MCKAFIAKAVWDLPTTRDLIDAVRHRPTLRRLCGWETLKDVPSESTFSRAFGAFAEDELPQRIQEAMIKERYGDKIAAPGRDRRRHPGQLAGDRGRPD